MNFYSQDLFKVKIKTKTGIRYTTTTSSSIHEALREAQYFIDKEEKVLEIIEVKVEVEDTEVQDE